MSGGYLGDLQAEVVKKMPVNVNNCQLQTASDGLIKPFHFFNQIKLSFYCRLAEVSACDIMMCLLSMLQRLLSSALA